MDAIAQLWRSPTQIRDMVKDVAAFGCRIGNIEILWNPGVTIWSKKSWNSEDAVFHPTTHGWLRNEKINSQKRPRLTGVIIAAKEEGGSGQAEVFWRPSFWMLFYAAMVLKKYLFIFFGGGTIYNMF